MVKQEKNHEKNGNLKVILYRLDEIENKLDGLSDQIKNEYVTRVEYDLRYGQMRGQIDSVTKTIYTTAITVLMIVVVAIVNLVVKK